MGELDIAGQMFMVSKALRRLGIEARCVTLKQTYLEYPMDIYYPTCDRDELKSLIEEADVFVFCNYIPVVPELSMSKIRRYVLHVHGSFARMNQDKLTVMWIRTGAMIVSRADPTVFTKVPCVVIPLTIDPEYLPKPNRNPKKIRVCHSPTNRQFKSTDVFLEVMEEIEKEYPYVETVLIEGKPWMECLSIKSRCDICFDHLGRVEGVYGLAGIEGMAFGQPTLAYVSTLAEVYLPSPPIVNVHDKESLKKALLRLIRDDDLRKEIGERSMEYVKKVHYPEPTGVKWLKLLTSQVKK